MQGDFRNVVQGFLREKALVGGQDDVVEGEQARQGVVVNDSVGLVFVKIFTFLFIHVQAGGPHFF